MTYLALMSFAKVTGARLKTEPKVLGGKHGRLTVPTHRLRFAYLD